MLDYLIDDGPLANDIDGINEFQAAKTWRYPRDPLALDLDHDGLETTSLKSGVHFDHNADGILTASGWLKGDDAFLVRDLNNNGLIDSGRELFGDNTLLPDTTNATNGFAALAALDGNADGVIDVKDAAFTALKLWQDFNQDGISQADELKTLGDAGIASLNLSASLSNRALGNGNTLIRESAFTRTDGTYGRSGELNLAIDTADTRFATAVDVPEALKTLPNMTGAGSVRELLQAAAQSSSLQERLSQFQAAGSRAEQKALLDQLLADWADTSGMAKSMDERTAGQYRVEYMGFGSEQRNRHMNTAWLTDPATTAERSRIYQERPLNTDNPMFDETYRNLISSWNQKLHILEAFNGQYFFNLPNQKSETLGANFGFTLAASSQQAANYSPIPTDPTNFTPVIAISFAQKQLDLLTQAYTALRDSVYGELVLQTRLKPYMDQITAVADANGLRLDVSAVNQSIQNEILADPEAGLGDLLDFDRYAGGILAGSNWDGMLGFETLIGGLPETPGITALLEEFKVQHLTADSDIVHLGSNNGLGADNDIALAGDGDDTLYGNNGNDRLYGQAGNDKLIGGEGGDLLSGGTGDDLLSGNYGADTYLFSSGGGHDTIFDQKENGQQLDTVRFLGLMPTDVVVSADTQGNLAFTIKATGDSLSVRNNLDLDKSSNGVGRYIFDNGIVWSHDDALKATTGSATEFADVIFGSALSDTIEGLAGDDMLFGGSGDDVIDGGPGNDMLLGDTRNYYKGIRSVVFTQDPGSNGNDTYLFGRGDGQDTLIDTDWTPGNLDTLRFKQDILPDDVSISRSGTALLLSIRGTTDGVTIRNYFGDADDGSNAPYQIEKITFGNGTTWQFADVQSILFAGSENAETIVGSRLSNHLSGQGGDDELLGNDGNDLLEGGTGDDLLQGRAGNDSLWGEVGNDTLNGGSGNDLLRGGTERDVLLGGPGNNTYVLEVGSGLDEVHADQLFVADDTLVFGAGVRPEDVTVQLDHLDVSNITHVQMVVGIGGNDAFLIQNVNKSDLSEGGVQHFRFEDGTEYSLAEMMARSDGVVGRQERYPGDASALVGSEADDDIHDYSGEANLVVRARGNNDTIALLSGNDIVSAGTGEDSVDGGDGNDVIAGEAGNDQLYGGPGNDIFVFNRGDGDDVVSVNTGTDTLSFGIDIFPEQLSVAFDGQAHLTLFLDEGRAGSITLVDVGMDSAQGEFVGVAKYLQFVDAEGGVRVFDFAAWLQSQTATLAAGNEDSPLAFLGGAFELTGSIAPARSLEAIAYAQQGDLFAQPILNNNIATSGSDVLFGTKETDIINGEAGNDCILGLDGNDTLYGGVGNDIIYGGLGADSLVGGGGNDQLFGEEGGDTYTVQLGDGETIIDDDHYVRGLGDADSEVPLADYLDPDPNILIFGAGIRPEDLLYSELNGDLLIEFSQSTDRVILRGYDSSRETQTRSIDIFRFADGTEITASIPEYAENNDWQYGKNISDTLIGSEGNDQLVGSGGADYLVGGVGSDTYVVYQSTSNPIISETIIREIWQSSDFNLLEIDSDLNPDQAYLEFDGQDLLLRLGNGGDSVRFSGFDPRVSGMQPPVDQVSFLAYGVVLDFADLLARGIHIEGTPQSDALTGTALSDYFVGMASDDQMSGGVGNDIYLIEPEGGVDTIIDQADASGGNLVIFPSDLSIDDIQLSFNSADGYLIVSSSTTGNVICLPGFDPEKPLEGPRAVERFRFGESGPEISYEELLSRGFDIVGTSGADQLSGTALQDRIQGLDDADLIDATPGGDYLAGGLGDDQYIVNLGDGIVTIDDLAQLGEGNILRFGEGISTDNLRTNLRFESDEQGGYALLLPYGNEGDVVRLLGFTPENVENGEYAIEQFEFADGSVVDYATLLSWTFVIEGDSSGNALSGTSTVDRLYGYADDDLLDAGAGNDVLTGGGGNDELVGGAGRDAYVFELGDGTDIVVDSVESGLGNVIAFGADITRENVLLEQDGTDLIVRYGALGDTVRVTNYAPEGMEAGTVIDALEFSDGTTVSLREFMNHQPEQNASVGDQLILEDAPFSLHLPDDVFIDADGDSLFESISISGYEHVPTWLKYDSATRTLYGTPENADVGEFKVTISAMDTMGTSATQTFVVGVKNTNDAPEVEILFCDQAAIQGQEFIYTLPEYSFRDVDHADKLTLSAMMANGDPLPAWLAFDNSVGAFFGVPSNADVGELNVSVVATDLAGSSVSQLFNLKVIDTNDSPVIKQLLNGISVQEDEGFTFTLPADTFLDIDASDKLTLSASLADGSGLPDWLSFDAITGTLSGLPGNEKVGDWAVAITATDLTGAHVSTGLTISVGNVNDAPIVMGESYTVTEDSPLNMNSTVLLANDVDIDPTGDVLSIVSVGDAAHGSVTLSDGGAVIFMPNVNFNGQAGFSYMVSDGRGGLSRGQVFIDVTPVNDAPVIGTLLSNQSVSSGTNFNYALPKDGFLDVDAGDSLIYSATLANGTALPTWLGFDAINGVFSGETVGVKGNFDLAVTASDAAGAKASQTFSLLVTALNSAPVANPDSISVKEDRKVLAYGNVLANDQDKDAGTQLTVMDAGVLRGEFGTLSLMSNGGYTYVLNNASPAVQAIGEGRSAVDRFSYQASDGIDSSTGELSVTIAGTNDKPWVQTPLFDRTLAKNSDVSWQIPTGTFSDRDTGDLLSYKATLSDGKALPTWLKFNAATQTFSGRVPANAKGNIEITVSASDGHASESTASDTFKMDFGKTGSVHGNEGLGNGDDPPPPGHDSNQNDGAGSIPGNSGSHGCEQGNRDDLKDQKDEKHNDHWLDDWDKGRAQREGVPHLNLKPIEVHGKEAWGDEGNPGGAESSDDFYRRWMDMDRVLSRLMAENKQDKAWMDESRGVDMSWLTGWVNTNSTARAPDSVSLCGTSGTQLNGFHGLQEGMKRLG